MREVFNQKLKDFIGNRKHSRDYFANYRYNQIVNEVAKAKMLKEAGEPLTSKQYIRLKKYDVIIMDGSQKLIKVDTKSPSKELRYYCKIEDMFDILKAAHLLTGHKGPRAMELVINKKYCNVTRAAIRIYLSLCPKCKGKYKTKPSKKRKKPEAEHTSQTQPSNQDNRTDTDPPEEPNIKEKEEPVTKKRRITDDDDPILQNALHCIKTLLATTTERDEHSVFGEHVAYRIRNSNRDNVEITIAQHHIENIICNLFTGVYNDAKGISFQTVIVPKMELEL